MACIKLVPQLSFDVHIRCKSRQEYGADQTHQRGMKPAVSHRMTVAGRVACQFVKEKKLGILLSWKSPTLARGIVSVTNAAGGDPKWCGPAHQKASARPLDLFPPVARRELLSGAATISLLKRVQRKLSRALEEWTLLASGNTAKAKHCARFQLLFSSRIATYYRRPELVFSIFSLFFLFSFIFFFSDFFNFFVFSVYFFHFILFYTCSTFLKYLFNIFK